MFNSILKFLLTVLSLVTILLILTFRFIVNRKRNEDIYYKFMNDFFKFWDINLKVIEKGV